MRVIAHEPGTWFLFEEEERYFLSVVCGRVGEWLEEFVLSDEEARQVGAGGSAAAQAIATQVAANPEAFQARDHLKLAGTEAVQLAIQEWRSCSGGAESA